MTQHFRPCAPFWRVEVPARAEAAASLHDGWTLARTKPDEWATPAAIPDEASWLTATVPGTVASSLRDAGPFDLADPPRFDDEDVWYRTRFAIDGPERLIFHGLATIADIYVDGRFVARSTSMFTPVAIDLDTRGLVDLHIAFRALGPRLAEPRTPRARWRTKLATPATLRFCRTTLLGRMPGWCPPVQPVGPWRPIERVALTRSPRIDNKRLQSSYRDGCGFLEADIRFAGGCPQTVDLLCGGAAIALTRDDGEKFAGTLVIPDVAPWWPHTHGTPALHDVMLRVDGTTLPLGRTGFRTLAVDRDADGAGFALIVNGERIFCRGAVWTTPDLVSLPGTRDGYAPTLTAMRDAHMNMVRVGATGVYEATPFHDLCDELGLMVWQDFMLSNFDYPTADPAFVDSVREEADAFLARTQTSPSLAVLCGGSEIKQQAAMLGLPAQSWSNTLLDTVLPERAKAWRPDVPYVGNTPDGGHLPFEPQTGLCHYYGVSAYMRPLDDARHAHVRFATEALGFAHVPDVASVTLEAGRATIRQPLWGPRHPGDVGAIWFFEEVRNHYLAALYGVDPEALARDDADRYLDLSRAVTAEICEEVFARWRRAGSPTAGGLIWFFRDVFPGAGWGLVDSTGAPKAAWHAVRRAFRPVQVLLTDEGLNGTTVHLINETAQPIDATLTLRCLRDGTTTVMQAARSLTLPPRSTQALPAVDLWGAFFDTNYAYRFGPPSHDVVVATLVDGDGATMSEAFSFPLGRGAACFDLGLTATFGRDPRGAFVDIATQRFAQSVHIRSAQARPDANWFHLAPGGTARVRLAADAPRVTGTIAAINGTQPVTFEGES